MYLDSSLTSEKLAWRADGNFSISSRVVRGSLAVQRDWMHMQAAAWRSRLKLATTALSIIPASVLSDDYRVGVHVRHFVAENALSTYALASALWIAAKLLGEQYSSHDVKASLIIGRAGTMLPGVAACAWIAYKFLVYVDQHEDDPSQFIDNLASNLYLKMGSASFAISKIPGVLTQEQCEWIVSEAEKRSWTSRRHVYYPTSDQSVWSIPPVAQFIRQWFRQTIAPLIKQHFPGVREEDLRVYDGFVVKYSMTGQRKLALHRDNSVVTFSVLLSKPTDFTGGGTYFTSERQVTHLQQGEALLHLGYLQHAGEMIKSGVRYILVGFCDLYSPEIRESYKEHVRKQPVMDKEFVRAVQEHEKPKPKA